MKFIKPVVGISKIIDNYDHIVCGFNGVLTKGNNVNSEALKALTECGTNGKEVVILSNSYMRIKDIAELLNEGNKEVLHKIKAIISAGEVLHYKLKDFQKLGLKGKKYYNLGLKEAKSVFSGLDYQEVKDISQADFVFMGGVKNDTDLIENYAQDLEYAASYGLDFLCIGNDISTYQNGEVCLGAGSVAEQYALLGGNVITLGKPDVKMFEYATECFSNKDNMLVIGDSFTTDIKVSKFFNLDTVLISKGIHVNFLGEGYIPDVEKTRNMAQEYEVYPDYVMSGLRW